MKHTPPAGQVLPAICIAPSRQGRKDNRLRSRLASLRVGRKVKGLAVRGGTHYDAHAIAGVEWHRITHGRSRRDALPAVQTHAASSAEDDRAAEGRTRVLGAHAACRSRTPSA
jgi:hypothetical protein